MESSSLHLLAFLITVHSVLTASTAPVQSNFGDAFRSGQITIALSGNNTYNLSVPYASSLADDSIALALSMMEYSQELAVIGSNKLEYNLSDNIPGASNGTHAVFQVSFGYESLTTKAIVKYLACLTSIFSENFRIINSQIYPGTVYSHYSYSYKYSLSLNVSEPNSVKTALWMSGISAWKLNGTYFSVDVSFLINTPTIWISTYYDITAQIYYGTIRVTQIFVNEQATLTPQGQKLPFTTGFYKTKSSVIYNQGRWFDNNNIVCGISSFYISSSILEYSIFLNDINFQLSSSLYSSCSTCQFVRISCFVAAGKMCPTTHRYYDEKADLCYDTCPAGTDGNYLCLPNGCPNFCQTCYNSNQCAICSTGYFLRTDDQCYQSCPSGYYPEVTSRTCIQCPAGTGLCYNQINGQNCSSTYYLYNSLCVTVCPGGFYSDLSQIACVQCPLGCVSCASLSECQKCSGGYYMQNQQCVSTCSIGYYLQLTNYACIQCSVGCTSCTSLYVCSSCEDNYSMSSSNQCIKNCNPQQEDCGNTQSSIGIFVGAAVGGVVVLVVIIVGCCRYHRTESRDEAVYVAENPAQNASPKSSSIAKLMLAEYYTVTKKGMDHQEECCICLDAGCSVMTRCGHRFHVACLASWGKKSLLCPYCRSQLSDQKIEIYCPLCGVKKHWVTLKELQEMQEKGTTKQEVLCDLCKTGQSKLVAA